MLKDNLINEKVVGSTPITSTKKYWDISSVGFRALACHAKGQGFDSPMSRQI